MVYLHKIMWLRITFALLIMTNSINVAYANDDSGIDVVIVIDQSGSMSGNLLGSTSHPQPNDQYGHRISISKYIIDRLAEHVEGTSFVHRVSIIEFGTKPNVFLSNLALAYDPNLPGAALRLVKQRLYLLEPAKLDYTNTPDAIKKALAEFKKMVTGNRKKFLLLITDGRPSLPKVSTRKLRKNTKRYTTSLTQKGVEIWDVGLNDNDNYWHEYDGQFWEKIAGHDRHNTPRARLVDPVFPHLSSVIRYIVDEWLQGIKLQEQFDEAFCPPYLRRMVFDAHFNKAGARLDIINPNGGVISPSSETDTYARYVIDDPDHGIYTLKKLSGFGYKIYTEKYSPTLVFLSPKTTINQNDETRVVFQVNRTHTALNKIELKYPIDASIRIVSPSGDEKKLKAQFEGNGKFVAKWIFQEEGKHEISFQGTVRYQDGSQSDLLDNAHPVIETVQVLTHSPSTPPLWLQVNDYELKYHYSGWFPRVGTTAAIIRVALHDGKQAENQLNDLKNYITEPDKWLSVQRKDKSGVVTSQPIDFKQDSENNWVGEIPLKLNLLRGEGWLYSGELNLQFIAPSYKIRDARSLNGVWLPAGSEEKRLNGDMMTVRLEILLWWIWGLIGLILLVLIAIGIAIWYLIPYKNIKLLIYDAMEDPGLDNPIKTIPIAKRTKNYPFKMGSLIIKQFQVARKTNSKIVKIKYRSQDEKLPHRVEVDCQNPKHLEISTGYYMVQLECQDDNKIDWEPFRKIIFVIVTFVVTFAATPVVQELFVRFVLGD